MQEINLLKNQLKDSTTVWQKRSRLMINVLVVILILEITSGVILFLVDKSLDKKQKDIVAKNLQTQSALNTKQTELTPAKTFQAQVVNLSRLVDSHLFWSSFFDELNRVTLKKIHYTKLQADTTGKVNLEGLSANYTDLGKLLLGLSTSENFSNVRLLSSSPNAGEVSGLNFTIDFKISPSLLKTDQ